MSTRANIVIKNGEEKLFFYRHSDGYPDGTLPTLNKFIDWVKSGKIRDNVSKAAGWPIILGALEYDTLPEAPKNTDKYGCNVQVSEIKEPKDWKAGAYEPTTGIHGDIEYLYLVDLAKKSVKCYKDWTEEGEGINQVKIKNDETT